MMEAAMKRKQLDLNISKCSLIMFGNKRRAETIRSNINKLGSLKIGNNQIMAKEKDAYLGDILHEGGLAISAETTINHRYGRIFSSIIEVSAILDDFRIDTIGGLVAGHEIYELALLPSLLNNADVWVELNTSSVSKLDALQNAMFRNLFGVPAATPIPLLRFDLGSLTMEERVNKKKLNLLYHLKSLKNESLAGEIFELQSKYRFPGLVTECRKLIETYKLPNIIDEKLNLSKVQWKSLVKNSIHDESLKTIRQEFKRFSKLENKNLEDEELEIKPYVKNMKLRNARTNFRIRGSMLKTKMNMKHNEVFANDLWKCDDCLSMDSQAHIIWCPAYAPLREGKNLKNDADLVTYYQQVMKIREENEKPSQ